MSTGCFWSRGGVLFLAGVIAGLGSALVLRGRFSVADSEGRVWGLSSPAFFERSP